MAEVNRYRRLAGAATAGSYTLIVIAILVAVNFLANRYDKTFDSTSNKRYSLSDQSEKIAKELTQDVTITYWDRPENFVPAQDLLNRYSTLSPRIKVVYQDIDKNVLQAKAENVSRPGALYVQVGNKREEAQSLSEEQVTGAMVRALKGGDRTVCFTSGYGEPSLSDAESSGYSNIKEITERNNFKTKDVALLPIPDIPKDCTILVVAGPKRNLLQPAVDAIGKYVEGGGAALIELDPPLKFGTQVDDNTELVNLIASWGVKVNPDLVLDLSGVGQLFRMGPQLPVVTAYTDHPIVRPMRNMATGFPITRSLQAEGNDKVQDEALLQTTDAAVSTNKLDSASIDPRQGSEGVKVLAVAGQFKADQKGRFVVVGTSRWIENGFVEFNGNRDLYLNMLNWLSADEDLISIRPKDPEDRRLNMNQSQMTLLFYGSVLGIPLLMVLAGVSVWWKRR